MPTNRQRGFINDGVLTLTLQSLKCKLAQWVSGISSRQIGGGRSAYFAPDFPVTRIASRSSVPVTRETQKRGFMYYLGRICILVALSAACLYSQPTYNKDVLPIFQQQCQICHHPGAIGPFSLMDYQSTRPYIRSIRQRVADRTMPVWKPVAGIGDFLNPEILTQQQIDTITQWADAGGPEGNPAEAPAPLSFPDGWSLGQPDLVLTVQAPFTVAPGDDLYRCFSLATNLRTDQYVRAVEIRAGNRSIVHHAVVYPDPLGQSLKLAGKDPSASYTCFGDAGVQTTDTFLAAWAPGITPAELAPGTAMKLTAGTRLSMQLHYHPSATGGTDQSQLGIYFAKGPIDKIVRQEFVVNDTFTIPAGDPNYIVRESLPIPSGFNLHAVSLLPHMHLLGHKMQVQATYPDRTVVPMIEIDDWDFDYQAVYQYRQPVSLPGAASSPSLRRTTIPRTIRATPTHRPSR